jgi:hypothetical protein
MINPFGDKYTLKRYFIFASIFLNILLTITVSVLVITIVYQSINKKVFMQPPFLVDETVEMNYKKGKLRDKTFKDFAEKFISYTENLTPDNADIMIRKIFPFLQKDFYEDYTKALTRRAKRIKANKILRSFYIGEIDTSKYGEIVITGSRMKTIGSTIIQEPTKTKIKITYDMSPTTGFEILYVSEKKGNK